MAGISIEKKVRITPHLAQAARLHGQVPLHCTPLQPSGLDRLSDIPLSQSLHDDDFGSIVTRAHCVPRSHRGRDQGSATTLYSPSIYSIPYPRASTGYHCPSWRAFTPMSTRTCPGATGTMTPSISVSSRPRRFRLS